MRIHKNAWAPITLALLACPAGVALQNGTPAAEIATRPAAGENGASPTPVASVPKNAPEMSTHDTPATFTSKVNLVLVPVVARDKQGRAWGR